MDTLSMKRALTPKQEWFRSVSTNESLERREKRIVLIMTAAVVLIFPAMVVFHLVVVAAILFD